MQLESGLAPSLGDDSLLVPKFQNQEMFTTQVHSLVKAKPQESKLDKISASVVVGMTAQFVLFIFGLVTEFMPKLRDNILLSLFIGLCVGVIAFALMKEDS